MERDLSRRRRRWFGAVLFVAAFVARLLFWQATPDRGWPHSAFFKGDALVWTEYATALSAGRPFELGLPLRPPANAFLLTALGVEGPRSLATAQIAWCFFGALAVWLFYRVARTAFGAGLALAVGLWCAFSTSLLVLSTSLNNETPYLVVVGCLLVLAGRWAGRQGKDVGGWGVTLAWGSLNGLACLFRVEHVLFFVLATAWWALRGRQQVEPVAAWLPRLAVSGLAFVFVLAPWHARAWAAVERFNRADVALGPAGEAAQRRVEQVTSGLVWTPQARQARGELPGFARRSAANFVAATVLVRGGTTVDESDFAILEEAFGYRPRPLAARPFVALYGPLNFYLAQRESAPPGFDVRGLDRAPVLAGGIQRYPAPLLAGLPPRQLNFYYPPHVELVTDGYRLGWRGIRQDPLAATRRAVDRLGILWQGASAGWTGYNLPWGQGGIRRAVDLAVAGGLGPRLGGWALLVLCLHGLWRLRREPAIVPWLLFTITKLAATVLFFGYARHGAALVPLVALLVACSLGSLWPAWPPRRRLVLVAAVLALGLGVEIRRYVSPPAILIDGRPIERGDPWPSGEHRDRTIAVGEEAS